MRSRSSGGRASRRGASSAPVTRSGIYTLHHRVMPNVLPQCCIIASRHCPLDLCRQSSKCRLSVRGNEVLQHHRDRGFYPFQARRDEEYAAIRAEREKDRKARQAELAGDPFNKEVRRHARALRGIRCPCCRQRVCTCGPSGHRRRLLCSLTVAYTAFTKECAVLVADHTVRAGPGLPEQLHGE